MGKQVRVRALSPAHQNADALKITESKKRKVGQDDLTFVSDEAKVAQEIGQDDFVSDEAKVPQEKLKFLSDEEILVRIICILDLITKNSFRKNLKKSKSHCRKHLTSCIIILSL